MKKTLNCVVFSCILILALSAIPTSGLAACGPGKNTCPVNGCGPDGLWGRVIVDSIWRTCKFASACNKHDKCYSRCQKCGDLHGCPVCGYRRNTVDGKITLDAAAKTRKAECDSKFRRDIVKDNQESWFTWLCERSANRYWAAVRDWGGGYYNGFEPPPEVVRQIRGEFESLDQIWKHKLAHPRSINLGDLSRKLDKIWSDPGRGAGYLKFDLDKGKPKLSFVAPGRPGVPLVTKSVRPKDVLKPGTLDRSLFKTRPDQKFKGLNDQDANPVKNPLVLPQLLPPAGTFSPGTSPKQ